MATGLGARYDGHVPLVVVAGTRPAPALHADAFVAKPFDVTELVTTVERVLALA